MKACKPAKRIDIGRETTIPTPSLDRKFDPGEDGRIVTTDPPEMAVAKPIWPKI
jgi:hypothetical protein